jgi:hypothetical protein
LPGYKREKIGVKQTNFKANLSDWALVRAWMMSVERSEHLIEIKSFDRSDPWEHIRTYSMRTDKTMNVCTFFKYWQDRIRPTMWTACHKSTIKNKKTTLKIFNNFVIDKLVKLHKQINICKSGSLGSTIQHAQSTILQSRFNQRLLGLLSCALSAVIHIMFVNSSIGISLAGVVLISCELLINVTGKFCNQRHEQCHSVWSSPDKRLVAEEQSSNCLANLAYRDTVYSTV